MGEYHIRIEGEEAPKNAREVISYLREMACVDPETGYRRLPNYIDDEVFLAAARYIEKQEAWMDVILDRILSDDRPVTDADKESINQFNAAIDEAKKRMELEARAFNAGWNLAGGDHTQQDAYKRWRMQEV